MLQPHAHAIVAPALAACLTSRPHDGQSSTPRTARVTFRMLSQRAASA